MGIACRCRTALLAMLLAALGGCAAGVPTATQCDAGIRPTWIAGTSAGEVAWNDSHTRAELDQQALAVNAAVGARGAHLGQSVARVRAEAVLKLERRMDALGRPCVAVRAVDVALRLTRREVRVAAEIKPQSCLRREVEAHEQRHVDLDEEILRAYVPALRDHVARMAAQLRPVSASSWSEAQGLVEQQVRDAGLRLENDFLEGRRRRHLAEIDTPDEYARIAAACEPGAAT